MLLITSPTLTDLSTWYNVVGLGYGFLEFLRCTPDVLVPALTPGTVHVCELFNLVPGLVLVPVPGPGVHVLYW